MLNFIDRVPGSLHKNFASRSRMHRVIDPQMKDAMLSRIAGAATSDAVRDIGRAIEQLGIAAPTIAAPYSAETI